MELIDQVTAQQRALLSIFEGLSAEQFAHASLCSRWDNHHILAHLVANASTTKFDRTAMLIRTRGDRSVASRRLADQFAAMPSAALITNYRQRIEDQHRSPERLLPALLADTVIHTVDVCRPLDISLPPCSIDMAVVLAFLATDRALEGFIAAPLPNVTFIASDAAWRAGRGPEVHGNALDLACAMTARPNATRGLSGPGIESVAQWARVHRPHF